MAVILGTILIILMIVIGEERGVAGVFVLAGNMILLWKIGRASCRERV